MGSVEAMAERIRMMEGDIGGDDLRNLPSSDQKIIAAMAALIRVDIHETIHLAVKEEMESRLGKDAKDKLSMLSAIMEIVNGLEPHNVTWLVDKYERSLRKEGDKEIDIMNQIIDWAWRWNAVRSTAKWLSVISGWIAAGYFGGFFDGWLK